MAQKQGGIQRVSQNSRGGFTIIELIVVTVLVGLLAAVIGTRMFDMSAAEITMKRMDVLSRVRHAQGRAMKQAAVWGVQCDGADYWLFTGPESTLASSMRVFPGESSKKVSLSKNGITMDSFLVYFDQYGIPYTAYTAPSNNTKVSVGRPLKFVLTANGSKDTHTFSIEPETGLIR